ncbi:MAG: pcrA [Sedimentibacter sp.]|nr:pcrA [Sedimentibacter sp.]
MELLNTLNEKQREAAAHDKGPILVIAGAGTGKTRVLTHRIANLIGTQKAMPWEILAITFTNKAANEMKERISQLIDYSVDKMWIGTFHSVCVRMLRRDIDRIGYDRNFIIYDTSDQKTLLKDCIKELDLDVKKYNTNVIKSIISNEKNKRVNPDKFTSEHYGSFYHRNVGDVYALYEKKLKTANALDFDDLLIKALELLEREQDIRDSYQERFKYILVDEYQDTNNIQYNLVKLLGKKKGGENADITNILNFENDFEGAKTVKLEKNYRSTNIILNAANGVIKNNSQRKGKNLYTDFQDGNLIRIFEMDNEKDEAFTVASLMKKENRDNNVEYSEMAVLYRTNAQSRALEEGLIREGIPYKIVGGQKFYERKEIKDLVAYLMLIYNQKDGLSLDRIINVPKRKIGARTIEILTECANKNGISMFEACFDASEVGLTPSATKSIEEFVSMMEMLMIKKDVMPVSEFIQAVWEDTGYKKMLMEDDTIEGRSRVDNVDEFLSAAKDFEERYEENSLEDFLAHISLLADVDKTEEKVECVTLMTVHAAKGLEYDTVFITGLEEGIFPIIHQDEESDDDIEEERRLFYVAITRAKRIFLKEIPRECIEEENPLAFAAKKMEMMDEAAFSGFGSSESMGLSKKKPSFVKDTFFKGSSTYEEEKKPRLKSDSIEAGDRIMHKAWGEGTVVQLKKDGSTTIAVIAFENKGIKNVILGYAPIEKIQ